MFEMLQRTAINCVEIKVMNSDLRRREKQQENDLVVNFPNLGYSVLGSSVNSK